MRVANVPRALFTFNYAVQIFNGRKGTVKNDDTILTLSFLKNNFGASVNVPRSQFSRCNLPVTSSPANFEYGEYPGGSEQSLYGEALPRGPNPYPFIYQF